MPIPASICDLLWEYTVDGTVVDGPAENAVLERVMQVGGWDEMRWLLRTYGRRRLQEFLEDRGRRVLAPRELRFWAFVCGVPAEEQERWVTEARRRERMWRG